jgi:hypothetical protein
MWLVRDKLQHTLSLKLKMALFCDVASCSLVDTGRRFRGAYCLHQLGTLPWALLMEAVSTSETSVSMYQTARHNTPEDSHLHIRRRENLKSPKVFECSKSKHFIYLKQHIKSVFRNIWVFTGVQYSTEKWPVKIVRPVVSLSQSEIFYDL